MVLSFKMIGLLADHVVAIDERCELGLIPDSLSKKSSLINPWL